MVNRRSFITLLAAFLTTSSAFAQQQVDGVIAGGNIRPLLVALPEFVASDPETQAIAEQIAGVVTADLQSTGLFYLIPKEKLTAKIGAFEDDVEFVAWQDIGSEVLVKGAIDREEGGNIDVKFRIYDVLAGSELSEGVRLRGPVREWRRMAHKIADGVYAGITGEDPYFDSRIVYIAEKEVEGVKTQSIAIMDSDGANVIYLTDGSYPVLSPRFAPNNRDVIFTSLKDGNPQVVTLDTSTSEITPLTKFSGFSFAPRISPDGFFALSAQSDETGNTDIVRLDMVTGDTTRLTSDPSIDSAPSISPDSLQFLFESNRAGLQQLYVAPTSGGEATMISSGEGRYITPAWSPKGDLIAFSKIIDGNFHIGVMNIDGSNEKLLTTAYVDEAPSWAPNGRALVFYRKGADAKDAPKLFSISLAGRNMMAIQTPEYARDPNWSGLLP